MTDSGAIDSTDRPDVADDTGTPTDTAPTVDASDTSAADSSEVADTTVGPISPEKLTGLTLWLDSDKGITMCPDGVRVQVWADQSPAVNNGKGNCSGGSGGVARIVSAIKGHDAITWSGPGYGYMTIDDDPGLQFGKGPFAVMYVVDVEGGTRSSSLYRKNTSSTTVGFDITVDSNVNVLTPSAEAHAYLTQSTYHVVVVRGPALEIRIDGASTKGTTTTDDLSYATSYVFLGASSGYDSKEVRLAEMIAVKGEVTDSQVAGVELYLKTKYKLTF